MRRALPFAMVVVGVLSSTVTAEGASMSTRGELPAPTAASQPAGHFSTLPVGAALPSDAACAAQVRSMTENRPDNAPFNSTPGTSPNDGNPRVTGDFVGTTDEIIQWNACKWGLDEDWARAQVAIESWHQQNDTFGDFGTDPGSCLPGHPIGADGRPGQCPQSIGLLQVRYPYHRSAFEDGNAIQSTAYNVDYALSIWRSCFEGELTWLNNVERGQDYVAGDQLGCMGVWFSGRWYTPAAVGYMNRVRDEYFTPRVWERADFPPALPDGETPPTTTTTSAPPTTTTTTAPPTTSAPPTTTTTVAPTTTSSSSPPPPSTSTTVAPPVGTECRLDKADRPTLLAFCDTFDSAASGPRGRAGDLDPVIWGVSRTNTEFNGTTPQANDWPPATLQGCGLIRLVLPPDDVRICEGKLISAVQDASGQPTLAMYPKQPFNWEGRTGTIAFDVSANSEGSHAAWPEFWITDKPVPAPHTEMAGQFPYARHSVGFSLADDCAAGTGVDFIAVTRNYVPEFLPLRKVACFRKGSLTSLNHVEMRVSANRVEVWMSDPGGANLRLAAFADNANLSFAQGLPWLEQVHYNACKFGTLTQCDHAIAWDNLGWDGPAPYRDLSFDVPDAGPLLLNGWKRLGYHVDGVRGFRVDGVYWTQPPTGAIVTFNWFPFNPATPDVRVNGGPWISTPWPPGGTFGWRTIDIPIPLTQVLEGTNTIELRYTADDSMVVSNINLILIAGAPAPAPVPYG